MRASGMQSSMRNYQEVAYHFQFHINFPLCFFNSYPKMNEGIGQFTKSNFAFQTSDFYFILPAFLHNLVKWLPFSAGSKEKKIKMKRDNYTDHLLFHIVSEFPCFISYCCTFKWVNFLLFMSQRVDLGSKHSNSQTKMSGPKNVVVYTYVFTTSIKS